jgi:hypothetical protein
MIERNPATGASVIANLASNTQPFAVQLISVMYVLKLHTRLDLRGPILWTHDILNLFVCYCVLLAGYRHNISTCCSCTRSSHSPVPMLKMRQIPEHMSQSKRDNPKRLARGADVQGGIARKISLSYLPNIIISVRNRTLILDTDQ